MSDPIRIGGFFSTFDTEAVIAQLTRARENVLVRLDVQQTSANAKKTTLSTIQAKQQEISAKQAAEHKEAMQKRAASARAQLEQDIPGWNDTIYQQLMKAGEKFGFKPEEVATWVDPRAIKLLHAATNAVVPSKPSADKRTVVVPKAVKPGASNDGARAQQQSEAMKRLQGSGRLEDAAAVIRSRLG